MVDLLSAFHSALANSEIFSIHSVLLFSALLSNSVKITITVSSKREGTSILSWKKLQVRFEICSHPGRENREMPSQSAVIIIGV